MNEQISGILTEIVGSQLSVEILYDAICTLAKKANLTDIDVYNVLFESLLDWDK